MPYFSSTNDYLRHEALYNPVMGQSKRVAGIQIANYWTRSCLDMGARGHMALIALESVYGVAINAIAAVGKLFSSILAGVQYLIDDQQAGYTFSLILDVPGHIELAFLSIFGIVMGIFGALSSPENGVNGLYKLGLGDQNSESIKKGVIAHFGNAIKYAGSVEDYNEYIANHPQKWLEFIPKALEEALTYRDGKQDFFQVARFLQMVKRISEQSPQLNDEVQKVQNYLKGEFRKEFSILLTEDPNPKTFNSAYLSAALELEHLREHLPVEIKEFPSKEKILSLFESWRTNLNGFLYYRTLEENQSIYYVCAAVMRAPQSDLRSQLEATLRASRDIAETHDLEKAKLDAAQYRIDVAGLRVAGHQFQPVS
jgi:hypothetical protein